MKDELESTFHSGYHHISGNRFDVMQENLFTVSIIAENNHSCGARWVHSVYSGMVELDAAEDKQKKRNRDLKQHVKHSMFNFD